MAFDVGKTEELLLTRRRKLPVMSLTVAGVAVPYNKHATRWLGVFLDSKLTLLHHHNVRMGKARRAEARIKSLSGKLGLCPDNVRRIQITAVQSVALYGAELWYGSQDDSRKGQTGRIAEVQKLINRQARAILGAQPTTAIGPLVCEAGLKDADTLLAHRRRRFACRLAATPVGNPAGDRIRITMTTAATTTTPEDVTTAKRLMRFMAENAFDEPTPHPAPLTLAAMLAAIIPGQPTAIESSVAVCDVPTGRVIIEPEKDAIQTALRCQEPTSDAIAVYTDGFGLEDESCAYAAVTQDSDRQWIGMAKYVSVNKEAYDAELFGIAAGLELALSGIPSQTMPGTVRVFVDAQAALRRLLDTGPGADQ